MRPPDLPTHFELVLKRPRPHGTRLSYLGGCKCVPCRAANSRYETERAEARKQGDWNGYVRSTKTRHHLANLSAQGVGYKSVAKAAGVSKTVLGSILFSGKKKIRARTERKVLQVSANALPQSAILPAAPFWKLINDLRRRFGYSKREIAQMLIGPQARALQLHRERITLFNARRIMRLHDRLTRPVIERSEVSLKSSLAGLAAEVSA
jgi:hypothetical protein